jgi:hypothetical protein
MNIPIHLGAWMIPLIITIISAITIFIANNMKDDHWGFIRLFSILIGGVATITAWIVWGLMMIFKS